MQIEPQHLKIIEDCLKKQNLSDIGIDVYVFGSRAKNTARTYSDLDLALKAKNKVIEHTVIFNLKSAFSESNLPYLVDVIDLNAIKPDFYNAISDDLIPLKYS